MTGLEQLFIRACKSKDPHKRVRSVYQRFYVSYGIYEDHTVDVASILAAIVERYGLTNIEQIINDLAPGTWPSSEIKTYWDRVIDVVISKIRLSRATKFPGLTAPARLRKATAQEVQSF